MEAINIMFCSVGLNFKQLIGYVFAPIAFLMGIPWSSCSSWLFNGDEINYKSSSVAMLDFKNVLVMYLLEHKGSFQFTISFANWYGWVTTEGSIKGIKPITRRKSLIFWMRLLLGLNSSFNHFRINHWLRSKLIEQSQSTTAKSTPSPSWRNSAS